MNYLFSSDSGLRDLKNNTKKCDLKTIFNIYEILQKLLLKLCFKDFFKAILAANSNTRSMSSFDNAEHST